jgi:hypothetical protein
MAVRLLDIFKIHRLKKYDGIHVFEKEIFYDGKSRIFTVKFKYYYSRDTWDIEFVGVKGTTQDLWDKIHPNNWYYVQNQINDITREWADKEGIKLVRRTL